MLVEPNKKVPKLLHALAAPFVDGLTETGEFDETVTEAELKQKDKASPDVELSPVPDEGSVRLDWDSTIDRWILTNTRSLEKCTLPDGKSLAILYHPDSKRAVLFDESVDDSQHFKVEDFLKKCLYRRADNGEVHMEAIDATGKPTWTNLAVSTTKHRQGRFMFEVGNLGATMDLAGVVFTRARGPRARIVVLT